MIRHIEISDRELRTKIKQQKIQLGGNSRLKIYGTLSCKSGKRMKPENRVFFSSRQEAAQHNYRPCGHCIKKGYKKWKDGFI